MLTNSPGLMEKFNDEIACVPLAKIFCTWLAEIPTAGCEMPGIKLIERHLCREPAETQIARNNFAQARFKWFAVTIRYFLQIFTDF